MILFIPITSGRVALEYYCGICGTYFQGILLLPLLQIYKKVKQYSVAERHPPFLVKKQSTIILSPIFIISDQHLKKQTAKYAFSFKTHSIVVLFNHFCQLIQHQETATKQLQILSTYKQR